MTNWESEEKRRNGNIISDTVHSPMFDDRIHTPPTANPARIIPTVSSATPLKQLLDTIVINKYKLLGTAGTWFILDIVFYANVLFSGQVSSSIGGIESPKGQAVSTLLLQLIALPGYFVTIYYCDMVGLKRIQEFGYSVVVIIFFLMACILPVVSEVPSLMLILYGLTFFFQNFGPNTTSYVIPSLIFAPEYKATCHGISAAGTFERFFYCYC